MIFVDRIRSSHVAQGRNIVRNTCSSAIYHATFARRTISRRYRDEMAQGR